MSYNNKELDKNYDDSDLSIMCLVISGVNILQIFYEFSYHQYWMNKGINVEKR